MKKTFLQRLKSAVFGTIMGLCVPTLVLAQTATLLPNAKQQYLDAAGNPVAGGSVTYYVPGTTTKKTVWQRYYKYYVILLIMSASPALGSQNRFIIFIMNY